MTPIHLEDLGYDGNSRSFEYAPARVVAEHKEAYTVMNEKGEFFAKITGKHLYTATKREDYPAVGDWVLIDELPNERRAVIRSILPRKTVLQKKYSGKQTGQIIAANIDTVFIVEGMDKDYNLNRFERYLVLAHEGNIMPVLILNKSDLISPQELEARRIQLRNRFGTIPVVATSGLSEKGLDDIKRHIAKGKTYCFMGSSGVGKSTLINRLLAHGEIKTREISLASGKGRHTTTVRQMYFLENGGVVIDNPGTREVGIGDADLTTVFDDIATLSQNCKYANCTHIHEPGCAVLKALEEKTLNTDKHENYVKLKKEKEFYQMSALAKRKKDRRFGKFLKKAKSELER